MEIKHRIQLNKLLPFNPVTVELGCAEGFFSFDILDQWKPSIHYMVDMWESHPEFPGDAGEPQTWHNKNYQDAMNRVLGFTNVEVLRGPTVAMSQKVEDNSVDIVYVDACHSYECVKNDIQAWWPKLKNGGIMAFHDYENTDYGVKQGVTEFANSEGLKIYLIPENSPADAGAWIHKPFLC